METVSFGKTVEKHPFGELLTQYRRRKAGLTQSHLAELAGYDQAILVRMCQGKKDLTGPSGRERVVRLIETLADQTALATLDEANALLLAADLSPLFERQPNEARLIERLARLQPGHRVRRTNLPAPLTSFVGRAQEIAEVRRLLNTTRLLTLTGAGGSGKTRLALRAAADVLLHYSEGVWYAELASLTDASLIADVVARVFGLRTEDRVAQDAVSDYLRERHVLLVLDNCEHLIDGVAEFAVALLRACPRVTILATSREALNVDGEALWRVPPMQPDEAGQLFVERAVAVRSEAPLSVHDETIAHICQRLDGMPLAIELAAARLQSLGLSDIAARLDDRFSLLTGGRRGALPRHQTLRALIDWSYDALSEPEKSVFRRLGVFVGGWALEQAEQVVSDSVIHPAAVLPFLTQLVGKSMVIIGERDHPTRYSLLETIREYALEKMRESGEADAITRRHAEAFAQLAERIYLGVQGSDQRQWFTRLERDYPNLSTSLNWSLEAAGDPALGCRMVSVLQLPWRSATSHQNDVWRWVHLAFDALTDDMPARTHGGVWLGQTLAKVALAAPEALPKLQRSLAYYEAAGDLHGIADTKGQVGISMHMLQPNDPAGMHLLEDAIALSRSLGNTVIEHNQIKGLAWLYNTKNEFDKAEGLRLKVIAACRHTGDLVNLTSLLSEHANQLLELARFEEALKCGEEAAQLAEQINDPRAEVNARGIITESIRYLGDVPRAVILNESLLMFARERLAPLDLWLPILLTAKSLNDLGNHSRAQSLLDELMMLLMGMFGAKHGYYSNLFDAAACVASGRGDAIRAAKLLAISDVELTMMNGRRFSNNDMEIAPYIAKARAALGEEAYAAAYAEGCAMTLDQAIAYALSQDPKSLTASEQKDL